MVGTSISTLKNILTNKKYTNKMYYNTAIHHK
nr:MAG TPA: Recombinase [Caudoviricetes sp.]